MGSEFSRRIYIVIGCLFRESHLLIASRWLLQDSNLSLLDFTATAFPTTPH